MSQVIPLPIGLCSSCVRLFLMPDRTVMRSSTRDSKFNGEVIAFLKATGLKPKRTSIQAPWQNGVAERWIGSCRRELLDHVIPLYESH